MQINKEVLKNLEPCADRYEHFLNYNADFDGSFSDFLYLPNVNYDDKVWVAKRVLTKNQLVKWAMLCIESVVHIFEEKYKGDKSLSNCINFLKTVNDFDSLTDAQILEVKKRVKAKCVAFCYTRDAADDSPIAFIATNADYVFFTNAAAHYAVEGAAQAAFAAANASSDVEDAIYIAAKLKQQALNLKFLNQVIGGV